MAQPLLSDGFVDLCFDTSLNFFAGKCRVLVTGQMAAGGTATADALTAVNAKNDLAAKFGENSVLTDAMRKVFETCPNNIQVFAIPRADPAGAVAAQYTITVTGTATASGRVSIYLGDRDHSIDVFVPVGSSANDAATLIEAAIPDELPYTRTVAAGVITFTAVNGGEIGNHFNPIVNWHGRENYLPAGLTIVSDGQTVAGTGVLDSLDLGNILQECCYCAVIGLNDEVNAQQDIKQYLDEAWSCDTPQCFGHGYVYNCGTLGEVLARGDNSVVLSRMDCCPGSAAFPWNKVAAYGALSACNQQVSPELSVQGRDRGVLAAVNEPQSCGTCRTYDETVALRAAQFVVTGQLDGGSGAYTPPYVFNDVTNNLRDELGRENITFRSVADRRVATATAISIAEKLQEFNGLSLFTRNTNIKQGIFGTNPRLMLADIRAWAKDQIGVLFSEFDNIDEDIVLQTDFETAIPCTGQPGKLHLRMRYLPPVRIDSIDTTLQPEVLTNCDR